MTVETKWKPSSPHGFVCQCYLLFDVVAAYMQDQEVVAQVADRHTCMFGDGRGKK